MTLRRLVLYLLYFMLAFSLLAMVRFPGKQVAASLSAALNQTFPGVGFKILQLSPKLPFALETQAPELVIKEAFVIRPEVLKISLSPASVVFPGKDVEVSGTWQQGAVRADITGLSLSSGGFDTLALEAAGVRMTDIPWQTAAWSATADFILSFAVRIAPEQGQKTARGRLTLTDAACRITGEPLNQAGITVLKFSAVNLDFFCRKRQITVDTLVAQGEMMTLTLKGQVRTPEQTSAGDWILDLEGHLRPVPEHAPALAALLPLSGLFDPASPAGIPVRVIGPLSAPRIVQ